MRVTSEKKKGKIPQKITSRYSSLLMTGKRNKEIKTKSNGENNTRKMYPRPKKKKKKKEENDVPVHS